MPLTVAVAAALFAVGAAGAAQSSNHAPRAVDDTFTVGDSQVVTLPTSGAGSPAANDTDADGDSLVVTAVSNSEHGKVALTGNQIVFRFSASSDLCGSTGGFEYTVSDGQGGTSTAHVALVVGCSTPRTDTIALSPSTIAENEPSGTTVGTLSMTTGSSDGVTYTLVSGSGSSDNGSFTIDGSTLESAATFDYEAKASYSIRVSADVPGSARAVERALTVHVTDANDPPTDISLSSTHVNEGQPSGTAVGDFSTTDQDAGQAHTYDLVSGPGSDDNGSFTIDGSTLKTAASFVYATKSSYSIRVRTTDSGSASFEKEFTISVDRVNHNPVANADTYDAVMGQELDVATSSLTMNDTDPDGDPLTVTAVSNAVGGTVSLGSGTVAFTGDTCGEGAGGFDYTISDGFGGSAQAHVTINLSCGPVVTTDPASSAVTAGDTASFTSAASGNPDPTVQWQESTDNGADWSDISGATSSTLSFTTTDGDDGNQYRAVWTNAVDSATSQPATLTIRDAPVVTADPTDQTVTLGDPATFTASASGRPAPDVQWQVLPNGSGDWADINGANSTTLTFTPASGDNGNQYRAEFSNAAGTVASNPATLTIESAPTVTTDPANTVVVAGDTAFFTSAASGAPEPTVQWQLSTDSGGTWNDVNGATSGTLSFTAAANEDGNEYRAVWTNAAGSATSAPATLTVQTAPTVTGDPADATVDAGGTASFTAAASGNPTPTVRWQVSTDSGANWSDVNGATSTTYSFAAGAGDDGSEYRAVFTNVVGSTPSAAATLTVDTAPTVTADPADLIVTTSHTASFTSTASGKPSPTVQWQVSTDSGSTWNDINGATSPTFSFTAADGDDGSRYRAVWTNAAGTATSAAATLTVQIPPHVTLSPSDASVHTGDTATFTAAATGRPTPTVQWQSAPNGGSNWSDIGGATTTTLSFTALASDAGSVYRAVFTNAAGTDTTAQATLSVNTPPTADDQSVSTNEDTLKTIALSGGDADGNGLTFAIVSGPSHGALGSIGTPSCSGTPSVCTANVDYTPSADYNGPDSFTFTTNDGSDGSTTATVTITVDSVNDAPSFTEGANQVVELGSGPQTVAGWATAISPGPTDESGQAVHFNITGDSTPGLFSVPPAVSAAGDLTYTLAPATTGVATITLDAQDDGGTANGGVDTSPTQSFTITVDAPPTFDSSTPASGATSVAANSTITLNFSEPVNASASSFTLECPTATSESFTVTPASPAATYVLQPAADLPLNTTCTVTVHAAQITDADSGFHPANDSSFSFQTLAAPPTATADAYTATGNVGLTMPVASGVVQNDTLNGATLDGFGATAGTADGTVPNGSNTVTTSNGGTVTLAADGSFTYDPPAGYTGADSFYYDLHNAAGDAVGQATVTVSHMIWFVDNAAGSAGDGRLDHPFNSLSGIASINSGSAPHPQSGDTIFVYSGSGAYTGGITLRSSQLLIGQGAGASIATISGITLAPHSNTVPSTGGTAPTFTAAGGNDVTLATDNTVRGVTLSDRTGSAISGSSFGTLTVQGDVTISGSGQALNLANGSLATIFTSITSTSGTNGISLVGDTGSFFNFGGTLSGSSGDEFVVSGGSANVTDHGTIAKTGSGKALNVSGETGGTVTDTASITDTDGSGSGISLTNNTGATVTLTGGMQLSTGSNTAFTATGGGTVNVDNTNGSNTLATTSATALNVSSTTIGATGLKFQSISASGGTCGINLSSTGSTGGLTVSGTGSGFTGGTLQSASTAGVCLSSTASPSLSYMQIKSNPEGVKGTSVSGFTLANSTVSGNGSAGGQYGIDFSGGLIGAASISSSTVTASADDNMVVTDSSGTLSLTVTGSTFSATGTGATGDGLLINANGTSSVTLSATGSHFTNNNGAQLDFESTSSASNTVTFSSNTVTESGTVAGGGLIIAAANSSSTTLTVDSNTITGAQLNAIKLYDNAASGGYHGTVDGNTIGSPSVVCSGSVQSNDIDVQAKGATTQTLAITNNRLYQYNNWAGINTEGSVGSPTQNFTITGNTIADPVPTPSSCTTQAGSLWGLMLESGAATGDAGVVCANISGNSMTGSSPSAAYGGIDDFEFDEYGSGIFKLPSYGGGSTDSSALVSYIQGRNTIGGAPSGDTFIQGSGQSGGYFFNVASCPTPP